jgi:N6-L-threonylcarbamoyladenine synthase
MLILGIETSCDETSASIVEDGKIILSNIIFSQEKIHHKYGGVVPEIASREHVNRIDKIITEALSKAKTDIQEIDAISVTNGPGLIGSLLVGTSFAKALATSSEKPLIGVNHLYAHLYAPELEGEIEYPALGLIVSGGHTSIYYIKELFEYKRVARTRDDAAGEIFDKISKYLNLGYPGGPIIDKLAQKGDKDRYKFSIPRMSDGSMDFSFSGIKSAALRIIKQNRDKLNIEDFAASFQSIIIDYLLSNLKNFLSIHKDTKSIILAGGVSRNSGLRDKIIKIKEFNNLNIYLPSLALCTDNAAMIAGLGYHYFMRGKFFDLKTPPYSRFEPKGFGRRVKHLI